MGKATKDQLKRAAEMADLTEKACASIEQAGRGLKAVFDTCRANTAGLSDVYNLGIVQGYVNEAMMYLLEHERHQSPVNGGLVIAPAG